MAFLEWEIILVEVLQVRVLLMRITTKGQVTIPVDIRERLGLLPNTEVEFEVKGDAVFLRKAPEKVGRGRMIVEHLTGRGTVNLSTDEILAMTRGED